MFRFLLLILVSSSFLPLFSTNYTFSQPGSFIPYSWNDSSNWSPSTGYPNNLNDTANFIDNGFTNSVSIQLLTDISLQSLNITGTGNNPRTLNINSLATPEPKLIFANGASIPNATTSTTVEINVPIQGSGTLTVNPTSPILISGPLSGNFNLIFDGTGYAFLYSTQSTFNGNVYLKRGVLEYVSSSALPANCLVTVGDNSTPSSGQLKIDRIMNRDAAFQLLLTQSSSCIIGGLEYTAYLTALNSPSSSTSYNLSTMSGLTELISSPSLPSSFAGRITGGVVNSSYNISVGNSFVVSGNGTLELSNAASTYVSRTFIKNGATIRATSSGALGAAGSDSGVFVSSGGTLALQNALPGFTLNKSIKLNGPGVWNGVDYNGALLNSAGVNTITGNIEIGWSNTESETNSNVIINTASGSILTLSGNLQNPVSGVCNLKKTGEGSLVILGAANTFAGNFTIAQGSVSLSSPAQALLGNVILNDGLMTTTLSNQYSTTSNVTLNGGTWNMSGQTQTIQSLTFNSGNYLGGALNLSGSDSVLTMRNTSTDGTIVCTNASPVTIAFDPTNNGTARINSLLNLNASATTFSIPHGSATEDMKLEKNVTSAGALYKKGDGRLKIESTSNVALTSGNIYVDEGTLVVAGTASTPTRNVYVAAPAILAGTGSINAAQVVVNGTCSPGESIGTLTLTSDYIANAGSVLEVEISPTSSDLISMPSYDMYINPGASLKIVPLPGSYTFTSYRIVDATGGGSVNGTFSSVINGFPQCKVLYFADHIDLLLQQVFSFLVEGGNPGAVASALDHLTPKPDSDMDAIFTSLATDPSENVLRYRLNQMHPALYKGFAFAMQKTGFCLRKAILSRAEKYFSPVCLNTFHKDHSGLWIDSYGDFANQKSHHEDYGYESSAYGAILGFDGPVRGALTCGGALAYSYNHLEGKSSHGSGKVNGGYGALYASWEKSHFLLHGIIYGGYNFYDQKRTLDFIGFKREAKSSTEGLQAGGHLSMNYLYRTKAGDLIPYLAFDATGVQQKSFKEKGALDMNMDVAKGGTSCFRMEGGLNYTSCFSYSWGNLSPSIKMGGVKEWRNGYHYEVNYVDYPDNTFTVKGIKANRALLCGGGSLSITNVKNFLFSLGYEIEINKKYWNQMGNLQMGFQF